MAATTTRTMPTMRSTASTGRFRRCSPDPARRRHQRPGHAIRVGGGRAPIAGRVGSIDQEWKRPRLLLRQYLRRDDRGLVPHQFEGPGRRLDVLLLRSAYQPTAVATLALLNTSSPLRASTSTASPSENLPSRSIIASGS